jgi:hypothetical protein
MGKVIDITGQKFGRLTVIQQQGKDKYNNALWLCKCDCGNEITVISNNLKSGRTKSCGCYRKEATKQRFSKYNLYEEYNDYIIGYTTNTNIAFYVDKEDFDKIKNITWYENSNGYIVHKDRNGIFLLHRVITNAPANFVVDHINHNTADNRKSNLRITTQKENMLNKTKLPNGICKHKVGTNNYFMVQLGGKYRGNYKTYEEAEKARNKIIEEEYVPLRKNYL